MQALDTQTNISVSASAGTGKTYLLVSRLLRLLLENTTPNSILAITFTRKAANEMYERLNERLFSLTKADDKELIQELAGLGLDHSFVDKARQLYEDHLLHAEKIKITTFHAFCHDLLQRFPLEAGISPGFDLLQSSTLLKHQAWQHLLQKATDNPSSTINNYLETIFNECSSPSAVEELLLDDFLEHRSDWWALTHGTNNAVEHAYNNTRRTLGLDKEKDNKTKETVLENTTRQSLLEFTQLLARHKTKTNQGFVDLLSVLLEKELLDFDELMRLHSVFFTTQGLLRKRTSSKSQAKSMGDVGEANFLKLHESLADNIATLVDKQRRQLTATFNYAWLNLGQELLSIFQDLKQQQNLLDFSDLEWKVYQLLSESDQSTWVQYKLDQRIDHILIDEFQDTNPTQWHMLYPLLEEIANNPDERERKRSLFIVGDTKQSIYRFRRAEPSLFSASQDWLSKQTSKHKTVHLDSSRRSSPAIIDLFNQVFTHTSMGERLSGFQKHETHHRTLWGHTEILPLIPLPEIEEDDSEDPQEISLRNPLEEPRLIEVDQRFELEGQLIAEKIQQLVNSQIAINVNGVKRNIDYGDIMILVKKRRHVADYEKALLKANIPFLGTQRKSLLNTLEIQDIIQLCNVLLAPNNNLALAVVLRSPIFSCDDEDLMTLASHAQLSSSSWYQALETLVEAKQTDTNQSDKGLHYTYSLLKAWREWVGILPVHDLLDRIYHQGNIIKRYAQAFPLHVVNRVRANLTHFVELALEIDSGRYPSLHKFIYQLELLDQRDESPDELLSNGNQQAVRLLTIHSAKGLEAPIVFLADATNNEPRNRRHHALIDWPKNSRSPQHFFLSSMHRDSISQQLIDNEKEKDITEDANLLYVAVTRARQMLFISGVEPRKGSWEDSWYGQIAQSVASDFDTDKGWQNSFGQAQSVTANDTELHTEKSTTLGTQLIALQQNAKLDNDIGDSNDTVDKEAVAYGDTVHHLLNLLTAGRLNHTTDLEQARRHCYSLPQDVDFNACWDEAVTVFTEPSLQYLFDPSLYKKAYNEQAIHVKNSRDKISYGIIDRLLVNDDEAIIIDYKTGQHSDNLHEAAEAHRQQLSRYRQAVKTLWPDKQTRAAIVFTAHKLMIELNF